MDCRFRRECRNVAVRAQDGGLRACREKECDGMNQQGQWQVAGSAAEVYEKELVPAVFGPWAPLVIDLAHPQKGDRVIDVACGTGIVARMVANRVGPAGV